MAEQSAQETAVVLTLPTFDMTNVNVWFALTEAIFQAKHIHSQTARYAYIVEKLPPEIAADVLDLLETVPAYNRFDILKEAIIYRTGKSHERRLHDLFNTIQLGDSRPSQLLRLPTFTQGITEGGKRRSQQHLKAASTVGTHITNRLFYIKDRNSNMSFLIDTEAQLSVVPPSPNFTMTNSSVTLRAANGTGIKTFGEQSLTLDIGLRRTYQWIFTVADVKFPILGADFLAHYQLIVDLLQRQLSDSTTKLSNRGIISQLTSTELRIAVPRDNPIQDILDKFPSLIQPFTYTEPVKHSTVHRIRTLSILNLAVLRRTNTRLPGPSSNTCSTSGLFAPPRVHMPHRFTWSLRLSRAPGGRVATIDDLIHKRYPISTQFPI
ncbi:unnamed protein product [Acanthosepion pharaonis]|uniref:DUF7041 domain-containing protein n=1 Tax=Acanthosepion pharaonis TaxID=158019 RepID=A0A812E7D7_ACAPH|nr:unnamed protein product [Sepia pharaonis]